MTEPTFSVFEAKIRLIQLEQLLPKAETALYDFGHVLASKLEMDLDGAITPSEFVSLIWNTIEEFRKRELDQDCTNPFVGLAPEAYSWLYDATIHTIAPAVFPPEFAKAMIPC